MEPGVATDIAERARSLVAGGFTPVEAIVDYLVEVFAEDHPELEIRPVVERSAAEAMAAHLASQASWPVRTDCDRIDRAFLALERTGIVARQNFTCCQGCGASEIGAEADGASRGYVFYHFQDTESAVAGHGLYLAYGTFKDDVSALTIAAEIVAQLQREGLQVKWDGKLEKRIHVAIDWQRRRAHPTH